MTLPPPKASCNYFFFEASWFNTYEGSATQFVQETKDSQVTDASRCASKAPIECTGMGLAVVVACSLFVFPKCPSSCPSLDLLLIVRTIVFNAPIELRHAARSRHILGAQECGLRLAVACCLFVFPSAHLVARRWIFSKLSEALFSMRLSSYV